MTDRWERVISHLMVWAAVFGLSIVLFGVLGGGR